LNELIKEQTLKIHWLRRKPGH